MVNQSFKKRVLFIGIPDMAYVCLDGLQASGVNIVGVLGAKKTHPTYSGFKSFVISRDLNFIEYDSLDDADFIAEIKALNADIAVVCSFNYKIPKVLLDSVKDGFINVDPSLLPKYRGANPYTPVIRNGEKETGVSLHFMDETFDTGDLIVQKKIPVDEKETMGTLFNKLNILSFNLLLEVLTTYEISELPRRKQLEGEFESANHLERKAFFIDYSKNAVEIERFIRSLNPFLIATTNLRHNFVKVFAADYVEGGSFDESTQGEIIKIEGDKFYVATREGLLAPTVLQFGSFFIGTSKDFIDILNLQVGEYFS